MTHASSVFAESLHANIKSYNEKGHNRVVLLHGPPGTGKSYVARHVAHLRGGFSLRHKPGHYSERLIPEMCALLRPRTLILDDLDRGTVDGILDFLEKARVICPLIIVTANYPEKLDPALRRPGRFDESFHVEAIDPNVVCCMAPNADQETFQRLLAIPVAYIEEYRTCLSVHGPERAHKRLEELEALASEVRKAKPPMRSNDLDTV